MTPHKLSILTHVTASQGCLGAVMEDQTTSPTILYGTSRHPNPDSCFRVWLVNPLFGAGSRNPSRPPHNRRKKKVRIGYGAQGFAHCSAWQSNMHTYIHTHAHQCMRAMGKCVTCKKKYTRARKHHARCIWCAQISQLLGRWRRGFQIAYFASVGTSLIHLLAHLFRYPKKRRIR
jgi:hypothetical protein